MLFCTVHLDLSILCCWIHHLVFPPHTSLVFNQYCTPTPSVRPYITNDRCALLSRLLQTMHHLPLLGESAEATAAAPPQRRVVGVTADGTMWIYCLVQYADALLNQPGCVQSAPAFTPEQRQAWDRYRTGAIQSRVSQMEL